MISRLLGYLVTFVLLVLLFEGVLRLAGCGPQPPVVQFDADYGWAKTPSKTTKRSLSEFTVETKVNSKGLRGAELDYAKKPGTKRVLFVGDSFVQGFAVAEKDLFVTEFAKELAGANVEVVNGGTEGWSTDQEFLWFENEGLKYQPDVVVLCAYENDVFWCGREFYTDRAKPRFELGANGHLTLKKDHVVKPADAPWWKDHTAIGNIAKLREKIALAERDSVSTDAGKVYGEAAVVLRNQPAELEQAWSVVGALLAEFAKLAKSNGATPVLLTIPSKTEIHGDAPPGLKPTDEFDAALPRTRYAQLAQAVGFLVVDPSAALKAEAAKGERLYFSKDFHWNVAGNRVVADVLETELNKAGLVPPAAPHAGLEALHTKSAPTWVFVVAGLWLLLGTLYWRSYPEENPITSYLKVGALIAVMTGIFLGIGKLASSLPPAIGGWVFKGIFVALIVFVIVKVAKRMSVISELYGTFLRRGHWYMLPLLVVMLAIGMLLVVAASSPFVAPFIYTLF